MEKISIPKDQDGRARSFGFITYVSFALNRGFDKILYKTNVSGACDIGAVCCKFVSRNEII